MIKLSNLVTCYRQFKAEISGQIKVCMQDFWCENRRIRRDQRSNGDEDKAKDRLCFQAAYDSGLLLITQPFGSC